MPGFAGIFEAYRAGLAERDECDFDEQVYEAVRLLLADPELRARWQQRCRHLLVDEFQDLTPAYLLLLRLLASPGLNVFGVGDDDQTIYGYAGADPQVPARLRAPVPRRRRAPPWRSPTAAHRGS